MVQTSSTRQAQWEAELFIPEVPLQSHPDVGLCGGYTHQGTRGKPHAQLSASASSTAGAGRIVVTWLEQYLNLTSNFLYKAKPEIIKVIGHNTATVAVYYPTHYHFTRVIIIIFCIYSF